MFSWNLITLVLVFLCATLVFSTTYRRNGTVISRYNRTRPYYYTGPRYHNRTRYNATTSGPHSRTVSHNGVRRFNLTTPIPRRNTPSQETTPKYFPRSSASLQGSTEYNSTSAPKWTTPVRESTTKTVPELNSSRQDAGPRHYNRTRYNATTSGPHSRTVSHNNSVTSGPYNRTVNHNGVRRFDSATLIPVRTTPSQEATPKNVLRSNASMQGSTKYNSTSAPKWTTPVRVESTTRTFSELNSSHQGNNNIKHDSTQNDRRKITNAYIERPIFYVPPPAGSTIINNNNNNIINNYPNYHKPYHYTIRDIGNTNLGFFLGYRMRKLSQPSYHYYTHIVYDGQQYAPLYDHYVVYHYDHNKDDVPKKVRLTPKDIVPCPGDSSSFCPINTTSLCMKEGTVLCVTSIFSTFDCNRNGKTMRCVSSSISCGTKNSAPECKKFKHRDVPLTIPCVSISQIDGDVKYTTSGIIAEESIQSLSQSETVCVTVIAAPGANNATKRKAEEYRAKTAYRYTTNDTGASTISFYLGQKLQSVSEPSFQVLNYYENGVYEERYNHYRLHHYYHKRNVSDHVQIGPDVITPCHGDTGIICPPNTTALCLTDGAVLCLTESSITVPCQVNRSCVEMIIQCDNNKGPSCRNSSVLYRTLPCISTITINADVAYSIQGFVSNGVLKSYGSLEIPKNNAEEPTHTAFFPPSTKRRFPSTNIFCMTVLVIPEERRGRLGYRKQSIVPLHKANEPYHETPKYRYSIIDFDNDTITYYLKHKLEALLYPSYYFLNLQYYKEKVQIRKYNHYSFHHYYYHREVLQPETVLKRTPESNSTISCQGDSGTFCPDITAALCLRNGTVLCVTDALLTQPCTKLSGWCVDTQFSCAGLKAPKCSSERTNTNVSLPCMSFLKVFGNLIRVDYQISTSKVNTTYPTYEFGESEDENGDETQLFCVTIMVMPREREVTEAEQMFKSSINVLTKFSEKALKVT